MKIQKIAALILALIIAVLAFAACTENTAVTGGNEAGETSSVTPQKTEEKETAKTPVKTEEKTEEKTDEKKTDEQKTEEKKTEEQKQTEEKKTEEQKKTEEKKDETPTGTAAAVVSTAEGLIGTAFEYGGVGPEKFDNSGFVFYCFKKNGIEIPRLASGMATAGTEVKREDLKPGDVVVFSNEIGGPAEFVGLYVGEGKFIACNNPEVPTKLQSINSYWEPRFLSGRRFA